MKETSWPIGGNWVSGWPWTWTIQSRARSSVLIVGATQSGKTSSLVIPALLSWRGPVVVTSVKADVMAATATWRRTCGTVQCLEPGRDDGLTWNPLEGVVTHREAVRVAASMTLTATRHDGEFWNSLAVKLVGALMNVAVAEGRDIFDVTRALDDQSWSQWRFDHGEVSAIAALDSFAHYEARTLDSVVTTAHTLLLPWRFRQPLARLLDVESGDSTLYLCAPRSDHAHYEPLFRGALRTIVDHQQRRAERGITPALLLVLDEAATVASVDELDSWAATLAGANVTLISVVQDFAQLSARWGSRAHTIVNNHSTRVVLAGLADPSAVSFVPELAPRETARWTSVREMPRHSGVMVRGHDRARVIRLRPWWRRRRVRSRGTRLTTLSP